MESCNNTTKVPFDPGWNDPPAFSYNAQQTTSNRPRNYLNKRVAFPLSGTISNQTPSSVNMPPMPTIPPMPSQSIPKPAATEEIDINIDSESVLIEVKDILITLLEESDELKLKESDIRRRISVMEEMWSSGKLNKSIHLQMQKLAYALRDDQPSKADDIHRALMVDHVSAVSTWMPGIKQLIHNCIARSELLAIDKE